jgi:hypothetical protein
MDVAPLRIKDWETHFDHVIDTVCVRAHIPLIECSMIQNMTVPRNVVFLAADTTGQHWGRVNIYVNPDDQEAVDNKLRFAKGTEVKGRVVSIDPAPAYVPAIRS